MKPRYVLHPGWVVSKTDGQRHFIDEQMLMRLYRVHADECTFAYLESTPFKPARLTVEDPLIHLYPRYDGNYTMPERKS